MSGAIGSFGIGVGGIGSGGGQQMVGDGNLMGFGYASSPVVVLSSEMDGLQSSAGDVLCISSALVNSTGSMLADIEFVAGGVCSPVADGFLEVWILRSTDGGRTFWDGTSTMAPASPPDATIFVSPGSNIRPRAGEPGIVLPPEDYKIALRNQMGTPIPAGSLLRIAPYGETSSDTVTTPPGDVAGTTAYRIADMMERFGVVTYSQSDISVNPWGAGTSDYTTSSVIAALTWLTANSGMTCNVREYHVAGRDTGAGSNQLSWCPTVAAATGAKFDVSLQRGAGSSDATSLYGMAVSSANGGGWMSWAEGLNTPNDGSVTAANCVTIQQALYAGVAATRTAAYPVATVGPSFTYNTLPPDTSTAIANYLTSQQKSDLLAASSIASVRFFPAGDPEANDSSGRGGNFDDVAVGHNVYFGKPEIIGEFHPTQSNSDSPSRATDDSFGAYYVALMMLNAHRLGFDAWFWKSLFDIGRSGESPWTRVGLFPNSGSDVPRLPARTIRAMYALTNDSGTTKRTFNPSKLDYTIAGLPAPPAAATPFMGGHHRLFQNSGGTFFLFVWNEQYYPVGGTSSTVSISFSRTMAKVAHYDLTTDATTAETAVSIQTNVATVSFSLTASVHLFVIYPQGSVIPTESAQDVTLTSTAGSIVDSVGTVWTLISNPPFGLQASHAGIVDGQNIVLLLYHDHLVYRRTSTGDWSYWSNGTLSWVSVSGDPRVVATESADGTVVNNTTQTIYASQTVGQPAGASLNAWTLTSGAQVALNGVTDGDTSNVLQIYYHNHTVFYQSTSGNVLGTPGWWSWNGSAWTQTLSPFGASESAEGTIVASVGPIVYASQTPGQVSSALDAWALVTDAVNGNFQITKGGVVDAETAGVTRLYYHNHILYHEATFGNSFGSPGWWLWNGSGYAETPNPIPVTQTESIDGTVVTSPGSVIFASPTPGQTPGTVLDQWSFNSSGQALINGTADTITAGIFQLYYAGHFVYQVSSFGNQLGYTPGWWRWDGNGTWTPVAPQGTQQSIQIVSIPQQITGSAFTVTGTLSGYSSAPSLQYRDGSGNWNALPAGGFVSGTAFAFTHPSITAPSASAPAPAAAVGFNTRTAGPNVSLGVNWFEEPGADLTQNSDGSITDHGGQPNGFNHHCTTVNVASQSSLQGVAFGGGGYFEMTFSFPGDRPDQDGGNGWVAYWLNAAERGDYGFSWISQFPNNEQIEYDAAEWGKGANNRYGAGIIDWNMPGGGNYSNLDQGKSGNIDIPGVNFALRHRYAFLHVKATASTDGYIKNYFDGQQVGDTYTWSQHTGPGTPPLSIMDLQHHLFIFGTGTENPMTVYAFEAWQKDDSQNLRAGVSMPSGSTGPTTVSVRDAGNTSIQATSNVFNVVPSGTVTLSNILLSGNTLVSGAVSGTPVGTIIVTVSGGVFNGTLSVDDTAHFRIAGSTLQSSTTLSTGNYPIQITATMPGAASSPKTVSFTIAVAASGNATVNFAAPTGRTMSKSFFGLSTGSMADVDGTANPNTHFNLLTHATFRNSLALIRPGYLRVNADQKLALQYAQGSTGVMTNFWNNKSACFDTNLLLAVGVGPSGADQSVTPAQWAGYVTQFANAMKNAGTPITYWEVGQENGFTGAAFATYFNAIADALHIIDPTYKVGATGGSWWGEINIPNFLSAGGSGSSSGVPRLNFFHFHSYTTNPSESNATSYGKASTPASDIQSVRSALAGSSAANIPIFVSEYNMDATQGEDARQGGYAGAVYAALVIANCFRSDNNVGGCALWDAYSNNYYGVIGNQALGAGNEAIIDPQGYYLGKAGSSLTGPEYQASTTIANMNILAIKPTATTFAIQLINYDTSASRTVNLSLSGSVPSGTISRWEVGKSSTTPTTSVQPGLGSITVPSETIVILTGQVS